jgi:putative spermidine/putrescine transport system permease protein
MYSGDNLSGWQIAALLAPVVIVLLVLFGGGLLYSILQSLGYQPLLGQTNLNLDAYTSLLFSDEYAEVFWSGLGFSLWISIISTALSAVLAVLLALVIVHTASGTHHWTLLLQINLPVPHLVAGVAMLFLASQSGLLSRLSAAFGLTQLPADFPVLVRDTNGMGIILAYVWKETPFIGVIVLGVLRTMSESYDLVARNLGASRWQSFRYITLPLIAPSLLSSSLIVFAFTFGAYEIPALLGVRFPRALPVTALRLFTDADLNARPQAMALSILITVFISFVIVMYLWLRNIARRFA